MTCARTELIPSQEIWRARGGTVPRPWAAPQITEITPGFAFQGDGWTLTSCEVPHAQPVLDCMVFAVEAGGRKFVYSGDAGICDARGEFCHDADLLLHWCYRLAGEGTHAAMEALTPTPSEIAGMAEAAGVKRLLLSHFRFHMDRPDGHENAMSNMKEYFSGVVGIAEDLDSYDI